MKFEINFWQVLGGVTLTTIDKFICFQVYQKKKESDNNTTCKGDTLGTCEIGSVLGECDTILEDFKYNVIMHESVIN